MYHSNPYIGYRHMTTPSHNQEALDNSLKLIKEVVQGSKKDELFYDYLISISPTKADKDILSSIRDDEIKHYQMLRQIYKDYTGMDIQVDEDVDFKKPASYIDGIVIALFKSFADVEKYREIRKGLPTRHQRDILFDIITDELMHSGEYNFLYTTNLVNPECPQEEGDDEEDEEEVSTNCLDSGNRTNKKTYTLEEWEKLIDPLIEEAECESCDPKEVILASLLVGSGYSPNDAFKKAACWEDDEEND
ncbi:ferritin-like domain-containing protein [Wukongibacter baidiensis]|uniref:ferritin-like domain-containing protein n=1 Tax=Wukongibacter baidiensis TaxID=1723361 RepID=UPI003D7FEF69